MLAKRGARMVILAQRAKVTKDVCVRIVAECPAADVLVLPRLLLSLFLPRVSYATRLSVRGAPACLLHRPIMSCHAFRNNAGKTYG
jgi:retinol dehydrogenase-12